MKKKNPTFDIPLLDSKPSDPAVINPEDMPILLNQDFKVNESCIICLLHSEFKRIFEKINITKSESKAFGVHNFRYNGCNASVVHSGFGAARAGFLMEILISAGVKNMIILGSAGSLQPDINPGDIIIASSALRDEGTSYHYLTPSRYVNASKKIVQSLKKACALNSMSYTVGSTWTTDAIFRETRKKLKKYRQEKVLCVEIEASGLYAIAKHRGVNVGSAFYITDKLSENGWSNMIKSNDVLRARDNIVNIALDAITLM